ncbi:MAG: hypothetical protein GY874_16255 [Desulfobacteraceae bacterium]|nr:hypothetical protein [Desulfobacteraceae bacterium]
MILNNQIYKKCWFFSAQYANYATCYTSLDSIFFYFILKRLMAFNGKHKKLIDAYNALPPLHQTIAHLLSVFYENTARTPIVNGLKKMASVNGADKKSTRQNSWTPYRSLCAREQVINTKGVWSKGRKIAMKRLYAETDTFDYMTLQDKIICACGNESREFWYGYPDISFDFSGKALIALAGQTWCF